MLSEKKYKNLPLFDLDIDESEGAIVDAVAFVEAPAIERNFLAFSKDTSLQFSVNDEMREVLGPAMVPNTPIYRHPKGGDEFYVQFSPEVIRKISQVFFKNGLTNSLNIQHSSEAADAYVFQSFITDEKTGIVAPKSLGDIPEGTWILGVKVVSDTLWNEIKQGDFNGFSVEGEFLFGKNFQSDNSPVESEVLDLMRELNKLLSSNTTLIK